MSIQTTGLSDCQLPSPAGPLGVPPRQAWAMLGISNSTGYDLLGRGLLESYRVGRARRVTLDSVRRYISRQIEIERLICERRGHPAKQPNAEATA